MLERFLGPVLVPRRYSRYLIKGCCLGVAAILVVLSLFANYFHAVELQLLGIHPHLSVRAAEEGAVLSQKQLQKIAQAVSSLEGVEAARPAIDRVARLRVASVETFPVVCHERAGRDRCFDPAANSEAEVRGVNGFHLNRAKSMRVRLRGLETEDGKSTLELGRVLDVKGDGLDLERLNQGPPDGMPMAGYFERRLFHGASPLDDFLLAAPGRGGSEPKLHHFRLLSTLNLGLRQAANPVLVTSIDNAEQLLGEPGSVDVLEIRLREARLATAAASVLEQQLSGEGLSVSTWLDQDQGALRLLSVLRWVILVVASSVMVVAALGVVSTLSLVIMEGRRKIAMLRAMGLRDRNIFIALSLEGLRIATWGLASGFLMGAVASWALLRIPGFQHGLGKMGIVDPRVMLQTSDLALVAVATWFLFLIVAWWPAREACRIHPVTGLQS